MQVTLSGKYIGPPDKSWPPSPVAELVVTPGTHHSPLTAQFPLTILPKPSHNTPITDPSSGAGMPAGPQGPGGPGAFVPVKR